MPQRTIAEATAVLDEFAGISDFDRRVCQAEIREAEGAATASAMRIMDDRVSEVLSVREEALQELCAVRDAYDALTAAANLGRLTAADCEAELNRLRARQRAAERHVARTEEAIAFVEAVEANPVAYGDSLFAKFPRIRPTFSF